VPQISAIEPQKRKKNRYSVFLDGNFAFGISASTLFENQLEVGKVLKEEEIVSILQKEELSKLTDRALHFLSYRLRSEKEVTDFLIKKIAAKENIKYHQAKDSLLINQVVSKLKKYKYLNDFEFAKWFISSRIKTKPKGLRLLKLELFNKGIDKDIAEKVLSKNLNQKELAKKAIEKKIKKWQKLPPLELKKKVYSYLAGRGFDWEIIQEIVAILTKKR